MTGDLFGPSEPPRTNRRSAPRAPDPAPAPPPPVAGFVPIAVPGLEPGVMPTGKGWKRNEGKAPGGKPGRRAVVKLRNGRICQEEPVTKEGKAGWAVEVGTRWTLTGSPWDIEFYRIL